ncbi:MAG: TrmJ/YjtD family RNA methyltransferase [Variibacter sp.]
MPGAGTDKTKRWIETPAPIVVLIEPQLGENIGACARAMANFGISSLRLVRPRDGWPNPRARVTASGADRVLDGAQLYDTLEAAIADCTLVLATTARAHDQAKPVVDAVGAVALAHSHVAAGEKVALLFGRERWGLQNEEVGLADRIVTLPVNPAFASLNLAQAVLILAYEWFKCATGGALPFATRRKSAPAAKEQLLKFFEMLESELEKVEFFRPAEKRATMQVNLRNIFTRMQPTRQDMLTLHGVIAAIAAGRKGPARGGVLDGGDAVRLRTVLAEHARGPAPSSGGPLRGLTKLLRRNPTDEERALWTALVNDRRFAGEGFGRQVPVGPHITDFVSFPLRTVIDLVPDEEGEEAAAARRRKREWLKARNYRVIPLASHDVAANLARVLDALRLALDESSVPAKD